MASSLLSASSSIQISRSPSSARLGEHDRALGGKRFAEQNSINAGDELLERYPPNLER
jgi:hypothetical protein